jgi:O-acetyl-ADP-ribose deacetylase (regulator of RNase III)
MKIYLLDINKAMTDAWQKYFDLLNVEVVNEDFAAFMNDHSDIEAIVSPANSFGLMDGGYDKAITNYFGPQLMKDVQDIIVKEWYGEQPVGTSISVPITSKVYTKQVDEERVIQYNPILIHTPSMRTPEQIVDYRIIYQCTRTTLIEALKQDVDSIVIPAFGGLTGRVPYDTIAKMMFLAYKQICNQPKELNWGYACYVAKELRR